MNDLRAFEFLMPLWLLVLPIVWWLVWRFSRQNRRESMWRRVCDVRLLEYMMHQAPDHRKPSRVSWLLLLLLSLMVIAAAGPSWRHQAPPGLSSAKARLIALDLSQSMLVTDIHPNRFRQGIAVTREILRADFDGETGLIVFAEDAFVMSPLTRDANLLLALIDALEPGVLPVDGNRIDLAIASARDLLSDGGHIIVVTAGTEVTDSAVSAAQLAREQGLQVSVLAIGTAAGAPEVESDGGLRHDQRGQFKLSKTNFYRLEQIADAGHGVLAVLDNSSNSVDLQRLRLQAQMLIESVQLTNNQKTSAINDGIWLLWLILPLALVLFRPNLLWVVLLVVMLPATGDLYAGESRPFWRHHEREAHAAYLAGNYQRVLLLSANPLLRGSAYYHRGQFSEALEQFRLDDSAQAFFNRGNTHAKLEQFAEAVNAFAETIKRDPGHASAKFNKRLIEIFLHQHSRTEDGFSGDEVEDEAQESTAPQLGTRGMDESRRGVSGLGATNPADQQQSSSGLGASMSDGEVDPIEQFDGQEQPLQRHGLDEISNQSLQPKSVERWIEKLPLTSAELYRRKFLRDHQRRQRQQR